MADAETLGHLDGCPLRHSRVFMRRGSLEDSAASAPSDLLGAAQAQPDDGHRLMVASLCDGVMIILLGFVELAEMLAIRGSCAHLRGRVDHAGVLPAELARNARTCRVLRRYCEGVPAVGESWVRGLLRGLTPADVDAVETFATSYPAESPQRPGPTGAKMLRRMPWERANGPRVMTSGHGFARLCRGRRLSAARWLHGLAPAASSHKRARRDAIAHACRSGHMDVINFIQDLGLGADDLRRGLLEACRGGRLEAAQHVWAQGLELEDIRHARCEVLRAACGHEDESLARWLISLGLSPADVSDASQVARIIPSTGAEMLARILAEQGADSKADE